jgi:hypothetical protein
MGGISKINGSQVVEFQKGMEKDIETYAAEMYQIVFKIARHFIQQSKLHSIDELLTHNDPTYEQIAHETKSLASIMEQIAAVGGWNEERIASNAKQAAIYMSEMAVAIINNKESDLEVAREHLEKISFI